MLRLIGLFLLVSASATVAACDDGDRTSTPGGGTDSSRNYFEEALVISEDVNSRIGALKTTYPRGYLDIVDKASFDLQQTKDAYEDYVGLYAEYLDRMGALDLPEALEQLHDRGLAANRDILAIHEARLELLLSAVSAADVEAVFFGSDDGFGTALEAADETCNEFRDAAIASGVEWDQPCQLDGAGS
jgi:hypothetical protein